MTIGQLHLLVAEDHDFQRKTMVRMLGALGAMRVSEAGDGKAALDIFTAAQPPVDSEGGNEGLESLRSTSAFRPPHFLFQSDPRLVLGDTSSSLRLFLDHDVSLQPLETFARPKWREFIARQRCRVVITTRSRLLQ